VACEDGEKGFGVKGDGNTPADNVVERHANTSEIKKEISYGWIITRAIREIQG